MMWGWHSCSHCLHLALKYLHVLSGLPAAGTACCRRRPGNDLEGDAALHQEVLRLVHLTHAADRQAVENAVAVEDQGLAASRQQFLGLVAGQQTPFHQLVSPAIRRSASGQGRQRSDHPPPPSTANRWLEEPQENQEGPGEVPRRRLYVLRGLHSISEDYNPSLGCFPVQGQRRHREGRRSSRLFPPFCFFFPYLRNPSSLPNPSGRGPRFVICTRLCCKLFIVQDLRYCSSPRPIPLLSSDPLWWSRLAQFLTTTPASDSTRTAQLRFPRGQEGLFPRTRSWSAPSMARAAVPRIPPCTRKCC